MKLHWSPRSPYVRKVMIAAHELGLVERLDCVRTLVQFTVPHLELLNDNPLGKLPTLVAEDGTKIYDSPVVIEYLDSLDGKPRLYPAERTKRFTALRRQALGDGILDILLIWLFERSKPEAQQVPELIAAFRVKLAACFDQLEAEADQLAADEFNVGHITIGVALGYLDFRYPAENWRAGHPKLEAWYASFQQRASVQAHPLVEG